MSSYPELRFEQVDPMGQDAQWAIRCYINELAERFEEEFDPGKAFLSDRESATASSGLFIVIYRDAEVVGCGGVQALDAEIGEIKRMWIAPSMRGQGIGKRLLLDLEERAHKLSFSRVRLDTNTALHEAIALYKSAGYLSIERYNDNPHARLWFEKRI